MPHFGLNTAVFLELNQIVERIPRTSARTQKHTVLTVNNALPVQQGAAAVMRRAGRCDLLCVAVMPLSGGRVLLEQSGHPLLTLGLALACRLPLSLLQDELLIGRLRLVLVIDGSCHMLPQSEDDTETLTKMCSFS